MKTILARVRSLNVWARFWDSLGTFESNWGSISQAYSSSRILQLGARGKIRFTIYIYISLLNSLSSTRQREKAGGMHYANGNQPALKRPQEYVTSWRKPVFLSIVQPTDLGYLQFPLQPPLSNCNLQICLIGVTNTCWLASSVVCRLSRTTEIRAKEKAVFVSLTTWRVIIFHKYQSQLSMEICLPFFCSLECRSDNSRPTILVFQLSNERFRFAANRSDFHFQSCNKKTNKQTSKKASTTTVAPWQS